jgi:pimeloyl-ACP methyl ester carboxylesterase
MMDAKLRFVDVGGRLIAYREAGQGAALLLLHGFLCDSRCWRRQLAGLRDHLRTIAWDAPGAGSSWDPPETFTTMDYAHCLTGFLDAIDVTDAHVVGLSWGGILAQEFYRIAPARVRTLVLADTYAGWLGSLTEPIWKERLETCLRDSTGPVDEVVTKLLPGMFTENVPVEVREELRAIMAEFHPIGFRVMSRSSASTDTRDLLPRIDVPTLVLWGDDDRRSPIYIAEQLRTAIPNAEFAIIANAGHVSNMEQSEPFNAHVRRFCVERGKA